MKRNRLSLAIGLTLLVAVTQVQAQDATAASATAEAKDETTTLDAIQVTARKREETLQDVPVAVTAFTADTLDKLNIEDIGDLDAQVPNLTIYAARGSNSTVTAYIRGIGQSDPLWGFDPGVGIYLDDVYVARPQGALLDVFDVERIEVLRGPQGTLYGKNTIGGAIKYISRALPTEFDGFASLTIGSFNRFDAKAAIGGPIGGDGSMLRGRLAVASLNRDGYGKNLLTGDEVSDKDINALRLQLGAFISEDFDIQLAADWMQDRSGVRGSQLLAANPLAAAFPPLHDRYDIRSAMPNLNDTDLEGASLTFNWRVNDDWTLKYVFAKRESETHTNIDFDQTPLKLVDVHADYSDEQTSSELQANYDGGGLARGVMGIYIFDGHADGQIFNQFLNPLAATTLTNPLFGNTGGATYTESFAVYADWTFDLTSRLKLDVGARWTDEDKRGVVLNRFFLTNTFETPWFTAANFDKITNFTNLSPKVSLDFQLTPEVMVYGLATRGFKSGGYNVRANTVSSPISGEPFKDENVDSLEVGSKMTLLDNSLFLNLAYFHNDYKDIQLSVFSSCVLNGAPTFCSDFTNAGAGTVHGFEVEYQWLPSAHWLVSGNMAWLDAKYDEFISGGVDVSGVQRFTNAPEFSGAINVEYRMELASGGNLSARVGYTYQTEVWPTTDLSPLIRQGSYGLINAGVILKTSTDWTLSLQGTNLADVAYRTTGYNIGAYGALTGFYGPPREFSLSARYDF